MSVLTAIPSSLLSHCTRGPLQPVSPPHPRIHGLKVHCMLKSGRARQQSSQVNHHPAARDLLGRGEACLHVRVCVSLKIRGAGQASELVDIQGLHLPFKVSGCLPGTLAIHLLGKDPWKDQSKTWSGPGEVCCSGRRDN